MSFYVTRFPKSPVMTITIHGAVSIERFQQVIARGMNTHDQAHAEIKEMTDIILHGKPQQDYYNLQNQENSESLKT